MNKNITAKKTTKLGSEKDIIFNNINIKYIVIESKMIEDHVGIL